MLLITIMNRMYYHTYYIIGLYILILDIYVAMLHSHCVPMWDGVSVDSALQGCVFIPPFYHRTLILFCCVILF